MLTGDTDMRLEFRMLFQFQDQRTELDRLKPGAEDEGDFLHGGKLFLIRSQAAKPRRSVKAYKR